MPTPRPPVADPALARPDWTAGQPRDPGRLWLDKNENTDPAMRAVLAEMARRLPADAFFSYPDLAPLYAKLAGLAGTGAERLMLAAGSDGAIRAAFETFVAAGDAVIITRPTFAMYSVYCQIHGARLVGIDYAPSGEGPVLPVDRLLAAIAAERPRLVCLPNPDSPTGTLAAPEVLRAILGAAAAVGAAVLIDEAYHPFHADSVLPWTEEHANLVVTRSFGKAWGAAGLRVGYAAACPDLARLLHKVRPMYEIGALSAAMLSGLLDHKAEMEASVARLNAGKAAFQGAMRRLGLKTYASHGNFFHVAFAAHADAVHAALAPLAYYRRDFAEPALKGYSRFSAAPPEALAPLIAAIERVVEEGTGR